MILFVWCGRRLWLGVARFVVGLLLVMPASFGEMQRVTVPFRKVKQLMLVFCFVFVLWICVVTYSRKHNGAGMPKT